MDQSVRTPENAALPAEGSPYARHIPALDGIRGLALLGVAGSHLFPGTPHGAVSRAIGRVLGFGATGVDLFFVLSGFLITGILFDSLGDRHFFRKFYARRVLRIFPLYYGVIALYALSALLLGVRYGRELLSLALYMQNTGWIAQPLDAYAGPSQLPLAHFWSLAIEEQFYLVWPLVVFLLRRRRRLLIFCCGAILVCPFLRAALTFHGASFYAVHQNTVCRADSLLIGGALALLLRSRIHDRVLRWTGWLVLVGLAAQISLRFVPEQAVNPLGYAVGYGLSYSALSATFVGLMALALRGGVVTRLCEQRTLRWLGKYSYGLYVLHLPLFTYLQQPVRDMLAPLLHENKGAVVAATGFICFAVSVIAAYLSYNLYERRFLRLKRFFDYRRPDKKVPDRGELNREDEMQPARRV